MYRHLISFASLVTAGLIGYGWGRSDVGYRTPAEPTVSSQNPVFRQPSSKEKVAPPASKTDHLIASGISFSPSQKTTADVLPSLGSSLTAVAPTTQAENLGSFVRKHPADLEPEDIGKLFEKVASLGVDKEPSTAMRGRAMRFEIPPKFLDPAENNLRCLPLDRFNGIFLIKLREDGYAEEISHVGATPIPIPRGAFECRFLTTRGFDQPAAYYTAYKAQAPGPERY
jgi:hypothetical protein